MEYEVHEVWLAAVAAHYQHQAVDLTMRPRTEPLTVLGLSLERDEPLLLFMSDGAGYRGRVWGSCEPGATAAEILDSPSLS